MTSGKEYDINYTAFGIIDAPLYMIDIEAYGSRSGSYTQKINMIDWALWSSGDIAVRTDFRSDTAEIFIFTYTKTTDEPNSFRPEMIKNDVLEDVVSQQDVDDVVSILE